MKKERVGIIGGGVSGITSALKFNQLGFESVVLEKRDMPGGIWGQYYTGVRLQNTFAEYYISDFPWPKKPDSHPTSAQILEYVNQVISHFSLDVRLSHDVISAIPPGEEEDEEGKGEEGNPEEKGKEKGEKKEGTKNKGTWKVTVRKLPSGEEEVLEFDFLVIASGQFSEQKNLPNYPGQETFEGKVMTEREVQDLEVMKGKKVVVVGNGKSGLDLATFSSSRATQTYHVFRTPHWHLPEYLKGLSYTYPIFTRYGTSRQTCWVHPTPEGNSLHTRHPSKVDSFWRMVEGMVSEKRDSCGRTKEGKERLSLTIPENKLEKDLRISLALLPEGYYPAVGDGRILPKRTEIESFTPKGVKTKAGEEIECDLALFALGNSPCTFPFLPEKYRALLENGRVQLYRHVIHPRIPRLGFAGFNHGFLHFTGVELGTVWLSAIFRGELELPPVEEMEEVCRRVLGWKMENISLENCVGFATATRYQQYHDVLLMDLGLSFRRKHGFLKEKFSRYIPSDYKGVVSEYLELRKGLKEPRKVSPFDS